MSISLQRVTAAGRKIDTKLQESGRKYTHTHT